MCELATWLISTFANQPIKNNIFLLLQLIIKDELLRLSDLMRQKFKYHILALLPFLLLFNGAFAQEDGIENLPRFDMKRVHFGFTLGFNQMDFYMKRPAEITPQDCVLTVTPQSQYGFQIGIISDLKLGENLNLRFIPSLSFGDRNMLYEISYPSRDTIYNVKKTAESTFLDFPLLFKYKTDRLTNFRAYVLFGGKYSLDLASQAKKKHDEELTLKLLPHDVTADIGVGFDFYLEYFKFSIELRMSYGLIDVIKREDSPYVNSIENLRSKMFWVSFNFE